MGVKVFSLEKDTTLINLVEGELNVGLDEILELGKYSVSDSSSRIILKFDEKEIREYYSKYERVKPVLKIDYANAYGVKKDEPVKVWASPLKQFWTEGSGRTWLIPAVRDGASWKKATETEEWEEAGGYFDRDFLVNFELKPNLDLELPLEEFLTYWERNENYGIIIGLEEEEEAVDRGTEICFYGVESHTIFPARVEVFYDDRVWEGQEGDENPFTVIVPTQVKGEYKTTEIAEIRFGARPQFPVRVFSTSSRYLVRDSVPRDTQYCLTDTYTGTVIVPYDKVGTNVSLDSNGNFIKLDMNALHPERYYDLNIQMNYSNGTKVEEKVVTFRVNN